MIRSSILLCSLYFLALSPYLTQAMTPEQRARIKAHFEKLGMECIADNPITEDDINDLRGPKELTGAGVPCFLSCVLKKIGVLDDAGMLQKESVLELARKVFEDEEEIKIISDFLHSCSGINSEAVSDGAKGCDRAIMAVKCMKQNAPQFGIEV